MVQSTLKLELNSLHFDYLKKYYFHSINSTVATGTTMASQPIPQTLTLATTIAIPSPLSHRRTTTPIYFQDETVQGQ